MARNLNHKIPKYINSDFESGVIPKPPRIKNKETKIHIYQTNQLITDIENFDGTMLINAKLEKVIDIQVTTPLNFDISKPKFASVSDTGIWGNQLNGFIYEDIELDTSKYNFVTFETLTQDSMAKNQKWRIVNINKVYGLSNEFLYAEVSLVLDTIKTIKSLDRVVWRLVGSFQDDIKVKKIKIELDEKTILFPNGLLLSGKDDQAGRLHNVTYRITNNNWNYGLALKLIKVRQVNPLLIDDITFSDVFDRHVDINVGDSSGSAVPAKIPAYLGSSVEIRYESGSSTIHTWFPYDGRISDTYITITYPWNKVNGLNNPSKLNETNTAGSIPERKDFFSKGLAFIESNLQNNHGKERTLAESKLTEQTAMEFLTGIYTIDKNIPSPADQKIFLESNIRKIEDLIVDNDSDRKYFVLTKPSNLRRYFKSNSANNSGVIQAITPFPKTRMISKNEWGSNYLEPDTKIDFEIELGNEILSPRIELSSLLGDHVKITLYDKNNQIVGIPGMNFNLESIYDDSQTKTIIQL